MNEERVLATIRKIDSISPIVGADKIEAAKIGGWTVVVKKSEFQPGDLCVYCEIDSVMPEKPEFEFLREKKFRIKSLRLRGVLSQGICFPLSIIGSRLSEIVKDDIPEKGELAIAVDHNPGDDVTEFLEIKKWEEPISLRMGGDSKGSFCSDVPKTDEERIQNCNGVTKPNMNLDLWRDIVFVGTEKIDGTSSTFVYHKGDFDVCSRTLCLKKPEDVKKSLYWDIASHFNIYEGMKKYSETFQVDFAIQGEIAGFGVNGNRLKLLKTGFYLFNAFNINEQRYFTYFELLDLALDLKLDRVPLVYPDISFKDISVDKIIEIANGESVLNTNCIREGVVFSSKDNHFNLNQFGRVSFKSISNEYLLKHGL
jgi:RNA ligase (TIGR02306 family)